MGKFSHESVNMSIISRQYDVSSVTNNGSDVTFTISSSDTNVPFALAATEYVGYCKNDGTVSGWSTISSITKPSATQFIVTFSSPPNPTVDTNGGKLVLVSYDRNKYNATFDTPQAGQNTIQSVKFALNDAINSLFHKESKKTTMVAVVSLLNGKTANVLNLSYDTSYLTIFVDQDLYADVSSTNKTTKFLIISNKTESNSLAQVLNATSTLLNTTTAEAVAQSMSIATTSPTYNHLQKWVTLCTGQITASITASSNLSALTKIPNSNPNIDYVTKGFNDLQEAAKKLQDQINDKSQYTDELLKGYTHVYNALMQYKSHSRHIDKLKDYTSETSKKVVKVILILSALTAVGIALGVVTNFFIPINKLIPICMSGFLILVGTVFLVVNLIWNIHNKLVSLV